jgi:hypothetical protein
MAGQPPSDEYWQEEIDAAAEGRREFEAYDGDEYFIRSWVDEETSRDKAIQEIQEPFTLSVLLSLNGLECILADKYAAAGLKKLLIDRHPGILADLAAYAHRKKPKGKPGPRPKDGQYKQDKAVELRKRGLSEGKIAFILYGDASKRNRVSAILSQARKKADPPRVEARKAVRGQ